MADPKKPNIEKRAIIHNLRMHGWSYGDIAAHLGISRQRCQQLIHPPTKVCWALKRRAKWKCEDCGIRVRTGQIHNIDPAAYDRNNMNNLKYLCTSCHVLLEIELYA